MTYSTNRPSTAGATQHEVDQTAEKAHDVVDRTTDNVHATVDTVADKAQQVADKVQDVGAQVVDKTQDLGAQAVNRADAATTTVGGKMTDVAQTIRDNAPTSGPIANAAGTAADTLERAGSYLKQQDLSEMRADVEGIIRRYPVQSLLVGMGVGYLLARSMRR